MSATRHTALLILALAALTLAPLNSNPAQRPEGELERAFRNPPDSAKPRAWWHWLNGNVTKEGITADLEWMHRAGIAGMQMFDGNLGTPQFVDKRLVWMTPEWKDALRHAANEAGRLGMEMAMAASGGWSETGGPWVKPQAAMKKIVWSELQVNGPRKFSGVLPHPPSNNGRFQDMGTPAELKNLVPQGLPGAKPEPPAPPKVPAPTFYADSKVVAYRLPAGEIPMADAHPKVTTSEPGLNPAVLTDGEFATEVTLHLHGGDTQVWVQFEFPQPFPAQAIMLGAGNVNVFSGGTVADGELQSSDDGIRWSAVASLSAPYFVNRDFPVQTYSFPAIAARYFRVMLRPAPADAGVMALTEVGVRAPASGIVRLAEIELSGPRVNHWQGKAAFGDTSDFSSISTPHVESSQTVARSQVIDLTSRMRPDGSLVWDVPAGRWVILRLGYSLTGKKNHPASAEATGYEVDKLSARHVSDYAKTYVEMVSGAIGPEFGRSFRYFLMDSWEAGVENWTDNMIAEFQARRGYDPTPFLPVLTGRFVESSEVSDRFLWDFRRTIADLLAQNHYGVMTRYFHQFGVGLYAEAEGPFSPTTADALMSKSFLDIPMAEFWTPPPGRKDAYYHCTDLWEAASAAHVYGKKLAAAESFSTNANAPVWASPYYLKPLADRAMSFGINRFVLASSDHQPFVDGRHKPGMTLGFAGQNLTRNNTWAHQTIAFNTYLTRCAFLLQQGQFMGDLAYIVADGVPGTVFFWKPLKPAIAYGYGLDWMNADVVLNRLSVRDGRLVLPDGMSYRVLVVPDYVTEMTLPLVRKLRDLVAAGGIVVAARPSGSPSLSDEDKMSEYRSIVVELWGGMDGMSGNERDYGKGKIYWGKPLEDILTAAQAPPDFEHNMPESDSDLVWIHRRDGNRDIYFVANQNDRPEDVQATFRVAGKEAELWHPDTGQTEPAEYQTQGVRTRVPLHLDPNGSVFVVFQHPTSTTARTLPHPVTAELATLKGHWQVSFPPDWGAPPEVRFDELISWTRRPEDGVKYFSGTATYAQDFDAPPEWFKPGAKLLLDLGTVKEIAEVLVNGQPVGGILWKPPYRADLTPALKPGKNYLEVQVTNLWPNRIIGDQQLGATGHYAWLDYRPFKADSPLLESGLLGPVKVERITGPPPF